MARANVRWGAGLIAEGQGVAAFPSQDQFTKVIAPNGLSRRSEGQSAIAVILRNLGRELRLLYDGLTAQPLPEHLTHILPHLDQMGRPATKPAWND